MDEDAGHGEGAGMASGMQAMDGGKEPTQGEQSMAPMKMGEGAGHADSAGMAPGMESMAGHGTQAPRPGAAMPGMEMMEGAQAGGHGGGGGLALIAPGMPMAAAARTVQIEMSEWGFSPASLDVWTWVA